MEWWKLFSGTFVLIFLAELGDKTQLAAMAKTADSPGDSMAKWVVFLGASLALVLSTFIAVFLGSALKSLVPDERYIKLAAGTLFLIFGFMILYETVRSYRTAPAAPAIAVSTVGGETADNPGFAGGLALGAAMDFEAFSIERYHRLAGEVSPELAKTLLALAKEEESHLARLQGLPEKERNDTVWREMNRDTRVSNRKITADSDLVARLIEHEEASAAFYRDLASRTLIPSVRSVLTKLADEELTHIIRLREAANKA